MALQNLLDLEVNKVSKNIIDYSTLIVAPSGFGKSPFLAELYGERALMLAFENSQKGIGGIHTVNIDSYQTLIYYVNQLCNPMVREKFDVVIIDTLFLMDYMCEKSVTDSYGKDLLGDCLKWNKAYKIVDKKFLSVLKRLQAMNYTLAYACHPTEKKIQLADGREITRLEPKVSDRVKNLVLPEIDVRLFCYYDSEGNKVIYTEGTPYFDARVRVGDMDKVIPFEVEALKQKFAEGIERRYGNSNLLVDRLVSKNPVSELPRSFNEVMQEVMELGLELQGLGLSEKANIIVNRELGCDDDGVQRTLADVNENMIPALEAIIVNLKDLKENQN